MAREAIYTEQVSGLTTKEQRGRLDALATEQHRSFGDVLRQVIEAGLPLVEQHYERLDCMEVVAAAD